MKKNLVFIMLFLLVFFPVTMSAETKTIYRNALVLAYSPANNVYEDDNIKLAIWHECLWATNKTNKTIFLDLSQCFGVHNGSSYPLDGKQANEEASKGRRSTSIEDFISIAPNNQKETFIAYLGGKIEGKYTTTEAPFGDFTEYTERLLNLINEMINESLKGDPKGKKYIGTSYRHLTEDESIDNIGVNIAYAFNKRAEEWTPAAISTWASDVYFAPYYIDMPEKLGKKERRGFGVKKTEAAKTHIKADSPFEFDKDRSPIYILDWEGNYKKGTFELHSARISQDGELLYDEEINIFENFEETYQKQQIYFDGQNADWGKMEYGDR